MISWRRKRQLTIVIGVLIIFGGIFFLFFYDSLNTPPTCFDGKRNGSEKGTDCGGVCERICTDDTQDVRLLWSDVFEVTDGVYNALAYVENPNRDAETGLTQYEMRIVNAAGVVIETRRDVTTIPAGKRFGIFEGNITSTTDIPDRVEFTFTQNLAWKKTGTQPQITVQTKRLVQEDVAPRIDAVLENTSVRNAEDVEAVVIVYDSASVPIGVSRTRVGSIAPGGTAPIIFTWPRAFETAEEVCETPVDVVLAIDRSGSMDDDGGIPPEPLASVKEAAQRFVERLKSSDQVGIVSFANEASSPVDAALSFDAARALRAVEEIAIKTDGQQNTNLASGLLAAYEQIESSSRRATTDSVIVALTDGVPTLPGKTGDELFPETQALAAATQIISGGTELYAIGLGAGVNADFMRSLASSPEYFFQVFTAEQLESVYGDIATSICRRGPRVIEIITRIVPELL